MTSEQFLNYWSKQPSRLHDGSAIRSKRVPAPGGKTKVRVFLAEDIEAVLRGDESADIESDRELGRLSMNDEFPWEIDLIETQLVDAAKLIQERASQIAEQHNRLLKLLWEFKGFSGAMSSGLLSSLADDDRRLFVDTAEMVDFLELPEDGWSSRWHDSPWSVLASMTVPLRDDDEDAGDEFHTP